jgi:hypothetical protein
MPYNIPEDLYLYQHCCENLKSWRLIFFFFLQVFTPPGCQRLHCSILSWWNIYAFACVLQMWQSVLSSVIQASLAPSCYFWCYVVDLDISLCTVVINVSLFVMHSKTLGRYFRIDFQCIVAVKLLLLRNTGWVLTSKYKKIDTQNSVPFEDEILNFDWRLKMISLTIRSWIYYQHTLLHFKPDGLLWGRSKSKVTQVSVVSFMWTLKVTFFQKTYKHRYEGTTLSLVLLQGYGQSLCIVGQMA